ncbi:ATP-binding protein [Azospirillum sp. ST 5-10]|uniref:ATP-binding protein n=3 Tax=unclassified Azospirillum TaxID=2630922 RepID=UPI003F4A3D52
MRAGRPAEVVFGPFRLVPRARMLLRDGAPLRIGSRAMDILLLLAERPGATVASDELMAAVWPGIHVESNTLRVHIAALRRHLGGADAGHRYIVNVTGRGYALVLPPEADGPAATPEGAGAALPAPAAGHVRLIGRDALVADIGRRLRAQRLVTLVGPGGVGKTAVAAAAAAIAARAGLEVVAVDLSPLVSGELLTGTVASRLGLPGNSYDATATILRYLAARRMLLVLDTCEHVVADAARFAAAILDGAPQVHILATSREAMRIAGEHVHRVDGLAVPEAAGGDPSEVLAAPAVRLFVERAAAAAAGLRFAEEDADALADICRRLDGLPLAIELAAALAPRLGAAGLARALADRFALLTNGYRTALSRHQTLHATVDWSYRLLDERERTVFRRFGVFRGAVTWEDAVAVLALDDLDPAAIAAALHRLAAKSLLDVAPGGGAVRCRMLDTNRDFAWAALAASGERDAVSARHAAHWAARLEGWSPDSMAGGRRGDCDAMLADVRSAIRWCWATESRHPLGVRLTLAAVPLWTNLSLIAESIGTIGHALACIDRTAPARRRDVMELHAALGGALMNIDGAGERVHGAWSVVRRVAGELGDTRAHRKALWGLWIDRRNQGFAREALGIAKEFARLQDGDGDPLFALLGDRMQGISCFFVGAFGRARTHIDRTLARSRATGRRAQIAAFQFDQAIAARCFEAQILWLQGFPDQARAVAAGNVEDAVACDHAGSLSYALSEAACPIALRCGHLDDLERYVGLLLTRTRGAGLEIWHTLGRTYESFLRIGRGERTAGLRQLGEVVDELRCVRHGPLFTPVLGEYASLLAAAGRRAEAERAIAEAFDRLRRNGELWCSAELKRIRAELAAGAGDAAAAERWYRRALAASRRQGALGWELRAATSLARFRAERGGPAADAAAPLAAVLGRFTEGWETQDVRTARTLLATLRPDPPRPPAGATARTPG